MVRFSRFFGERGECGVLEVSSGEESGDVLQMCFCWMRSWGVRVSLRRIHWIVWDLFLETMFASAGTMDEAKSTRDDPFALCFFGLRKNLQGC